VGAVGGDNPTIQIKSGDDQIGRRRFSLLRAHTPTYGYATIQHDILGSLLNQHGRYVFS